MPNDTLYAAEQIMHLEKVIKRKKRGLQCNPFARRRYVVKPAAVVITEKDNIVGPVSDYDIKVRRVLAIEGTQYYLTEKGGIATNLAPEDIADIDSAGRWREEFNKSEPIIIEPLSHLPVATIEDLIKALS